MKIAHCIFTMKTGGAQVLVIDLLNEYCNNHDVSLVIVNDQWNDFLLEKLDKRIKIFFINRKEGSRNPFYLIKLHFILKRIDPDIIHCHEDKMINMFFGKFKTVFTIHDINTDILYLNKYRAAIAISTAVANDVFDRIKLRPEVIHNGIAMNQFRRKINYSILEGEKIRMVQLSRLVHEKKGQDILIRAIHELVSNRNIGGLEVDFIGSGASQIYLQSLTTELKLENHINFVGEKDRNWIEENLASYHILVQPSRFEGFGLTVIEGIAAGLPVVASDIEGPAEIMEKVSKPFLFKKEDINACADALEEVIMLYQQNKMQATMEETYQVISTEYSIKSTAGKYYSVYKKLALAN